jgi:hypothetical protein
MKRIFFVLMVCLSVQAYGQKANDVKFERGKKLEMIAESKAVVSQEMMGQTMDVNVNSKLVRSFDIEDVNNGVAKIEHKVKRLQFDFDMMGQKQSFDSENEADLKSEMGKSLEKSIKNKYSMMVDAGGKIVSVSLDDDNPNKEVAGTDMMSNMLSQFAEGLELPKSGDLFSLKLSTNGQFAKGKSWSDSLSGPEAGNIKYTVADVTGSEVLIDYTSEGVTKRSQEVGGGMTMNLDLKNKTTGRITVDKKSGLLKKRTLESEGSGMMEIAGQSIPMKSKVSGTITVNGL